MTPWFADRAASLGLHVPAGPSQHAWAWWGDPGDGAAIAAGGLLAEGASAGPGTIETAFAAVAHLRDSGFIPARPIVVAGLRPLTTLPNGLRLAALVEVVGDSGHVLGHATAGAAGQALGVGSDLWPHGRWRFELTGQPGAASALVPLDARQDPLLDAARLVLAAREMGYRHGTMATVGRILAEPNEPAVVPARVQVWLDATAPSEVDLLDLAQEFIRTAAESGAKVTEESWSPSLQLDPDLRDRIVRVLTESAGADGVPVVSSGAPSAAGIVAAWAVPASILYLRESEATAAADHAAGIVALAAVLASLAG